MNNPQAIKILKEEKSWESDDRKIDAFIMAIEALEFKQELLKEIKELINSDNRGNADYFIVDKIEEICDKYID